MVRPIRNATPLIRLTRESYQVFPMAATTTISPITEPQPFSGDGAGIAATLIEIACASGDLAIAENFLIGVALSYASTAFSTSIPIATTCRGWIG